MHRAAIIAPKSLNTTHGDSVSLRLLDYDQLGSSTSETRVCIPHGAIAPTASDSASSASSVNTSQQEPRATCLSLSLRGEIFHLFLSYRVKSESFLVGELYHKFMMHADSAKIPDISKWPSKFKQPPKEVASSRLHVFWDAKCLAPGLTWKDNGFVAALSKSLVFLPLLSQGVIETWCDPVQEYVDNVLLELILALEFNTLSGQLPSEVYPCKYIVPVFVNDLFKNIGALSKAPARETMAEAARILGSFGVCLSREYSPHSVVSALSKFQGVEMHIYADKLRQQALDVVVKEAVTAVTMCIQGSSSFMDDFVAHHPRAQELCDWLHSLNMSRYSGILAQHGITSVYAFSLLDAGSAIPALAEDCALGCGQTRVHAIAALSRALAQAKSSPLSLTLSQRCNRFVDTDASLLSALYSSCGIDAMMTKPRILFMFLLNSFSSLGFAVFTLRMNDQPFLCLNASVNTAFWLACFGLFFCCATWPFAFGGSMLNIPSTEFKPRKIITVFCFLLALYGIFVVSYVKAAYFDTVDFKHSIVCESALQKGTLSVSFNVCYLYEISVFLAQMIWLSAFGYVASFRQELASRVFCFGGILFFLSVIGLNEMGVLNHQAFIRGVAIIFAVVLGVHGVAFEILNKISKQKARNLLKDDETQYNVRWNNLMLRASHDGSCGRSEASALSAYIRQNLHDCVDELENRWFTKRPQVLQEHSSIDILFEDTECVDVSFQELMQCWLKGSDRKELLRFVQEQHVDVFTLPGLENVAAECFPGPVKQITRAIAKTYRSYRGNFKRLTDLVRTKVVFQKLSDIHFFLRLLQERSLCSPDDARQNSGSDAQQSSQIMQIMRVRNRLDPSIRSEQLFGGYRDLALKVKMGFTCIQSHSAADFMKFVPVSRWRDANVKRLVFEIQLHVDGMQLGGSASGDGCDAHHDVYVQSRNLLSV